jgi:tetratricopeptide (TPR) repeat protein
MRPVSAAACAGILHCLGVLSGTTSFTVIAIGLATAQQGDFDAILKRFNELYAAGKYSAALVEAQSLEAAAKARFGVNHANYGLALNSLAAVYAEQGRYPDAEALFKRALVIKEKALGKDHLDVVAPLNGLAFVYRNQGKNADAEPLYKRALAIREKALGADHPYVADSLNNLAGINQSQGKYADAEGLYQRVLQSTKRRSVKSTPI